MTIKEFNQLRAAVYAEAIKIPEIAEAIDIGGICYIYDVMDATNNHVVLTLTALTQLNDNVLKKCGIDPATVRVSLVMTLRRETKAATFRQL